MSRRWLFVLLVGLTGCTTPDIREPETITKSIPLFGASDSGRGRPRRPSAWAFRVRTDGMSNRAQSTHRG